MTQTDKVLYTGRTHTTGGRDGASRSSDGRLDVKLSSPRHLRRWYQSGSSSSLPAGPPALKVRLALAARKMKVAVPG